MRQSTFKRGQTATCPKCGREYRKYIERQRACSERCLTNLYYHENKERINRRRSKLAAQIDDAKYQRMKDRERQWKSQNAERYKACKHAWHERTKSLKWPVGKRVWYFYICHWCAGEITERPNSATVIVRLDGGTIVKTKGSKLREFKPEDA